jgi:cyclopropane fatty-acyl-phospholipid synthase-like methyltransferase
VAATDESASVGQYILMFHRCIFLLFMVRKEVFLSTLDYYNKNAKTYFSHTVELNIEDTMNKFISYLPDGAEILDVGCGSGRDSLYFIKNGLNVPQLTAPKNYVN